MRLRIALVAVLAALTLALSPYEIQLLDWQYSPANYPRIVKWAGCTAEVILRDDRPAVASYYTYSSYNRYVVIGTMEMGDIPYYAGLLVVFHETSHCLQHQNGTLYQMDPKTRELDADRWGADLACGMGLDGRKILHDTFVWAHETFGYEGDPEHGTLTERMSQGANARLCDRQAPQS